ncbi:hypothetical protein, partial [Streptomyces clavuligerus]|uniref:hypothetical protein n=1 Tax=Streptomyces clavuligerus TaxID=1901 RepID=UPI001E3C2EF8
MRQKTIEPRPTLLQPVLDPGGESAHAADRRTAVTAAGTGTPVTVATSVTALGGTAVTAVGGTATAAARGTAGAPRHHPG